MFTKQLITMDSIIADTIDMTDDEMLNIKPTLYKWGFYADKRIRTYYQYKRKSKVTRIENCCIRIYQQAGVGHLLCSRF